MRASIARHAAHAVLAVLRRCRPVAAASSQVVVLDDFRDPSRVVPQYIGAWDPRPLTPPEGLPASQTPGEGVGE